jgi:hypothetical protein
MTIAAVTQMDIARTAAAYAHPRERENLERRAKGRKAERTHQKMIRLIIQTVLIVLLPKIPPPNPMTTSPVTSKKSLLAVKVQD